MWTKSRDCARRAQGVDHRLGLSEGAVEVGAALVGELGDRHGGADHLAVDGVALDDAGVVLDADGRRQVEDELAEEGEPADVLEPPRRSSSCATVTWLIDSLRSQRAKQAS